MTNEQLLSPELDPGSVSLRDRLRSILAVPARLVGVLIVPDRVMPSIVRQGRAVAAVLAIVLCGLGSAYVVGSRIDVAPQVLENEAQQQKKLGPDYEAKSDRELGEDIEKGRTVEQVKLGLVAGLGQPVMVFLFAIVVFLVGRYVGGRTSFSGSMAAAAAARLPVAVKAIVVAALAWPSATLTPTDLQKLDDVAVFQLPAPFTAMSIDAFGLWMVVLLAFGLAASAGITRRRAFVTALVCYFLVLFIGVGIAGMMMGNGMPPGGAR